MARLAHEEDHVLFLIFLAAMKRDLEDEEQRQVKARIEISSGLVGDVLVEVWTTHIRPRLDMMSRARCRLVCHAHAKTDAALLVPAWLGIYYATIPPERMPYGSDFFVRDMDTLGWPTNDEPSDYGIRGFHGSSNIDPPEILMFCVEWRYKSTRGNGDLGLRFRCKLHTGKSDWTLRREYEDTGKTQRRFLDVDARLSLFMQTGLGQTRAQFQAAVRAVYNDHVFGTDL